MTDPLKAIERCRKEPAAHLAQAIQRLAVEPPKDMRPVSPGERNQVQVQVRHG
jgi:hypothetical protein